MNNYYITTVDTKNCVIVMFVYKSVTFNKDVFIIITLLHNYVVS